MVMIKIDTKIHQLDLGIDLRGLSLQFKGLLKGYLNELHKFY